MMSKVMIPALALVALVSLTGCDSSLASWITADGTLDSLLQTIVDTITNALSSAA
jgi:hypothetical protein